MKTVYVAMSGGVDSAVTAYLLKQQGYNVVGVHMKNWDGDEYNLQQDFMKQSIQDYRDFMATCEILNIPHKTYNFMNEYKDLVMRNFFQEYKNGRTPNPDILCNKYIKFDLFLKSALDEGADLMATGHYSKTHEGRLFKAVDPNKDQTYFLYQLTSAQLEKTLFPLGGLTKDEVRQIAKEAKLPVAEKKDSQGICFVGKIPVSEYLRRELGEQSGDIIDIDTGEVVGQHPGVWMFTVGQRKGLHIGGLNKPYFIAKKDANTNTLYVAQGKSHPALWTSAVSIKQLHIINDINSDFIKRDTLSAQIRYRADDIPVSIQFDQDSETYTIRFETPVWGGTSGQSVVIYDGDECLGGGVIEDVYTLRDTQ